MAKRKDIPRPYNGGQWTEARMHGFIVSLLRQGSMRWGPKAECLKRAYVEDGVNPKTNRKCKLHRCTSCKGLYPK